MKRAFLWIAVVAACGSPTGNGFDAGTDASVDGDANPFQQPDTGPTTYSDFPTNPVVDPSLPTNIAQLFGDPDAGTASAPCIAEPAADAMIPKNWTPLFLEYAAGGANVYEIRITVDNQKNTGVYYVPTSTYTLDQNLWKSLAAHSAGHDMNVSIRGGSLANQQVTNVTAESTEAVHIAPVDAPGSVVYWSSTGGTSFKGFTVGDLQSKTVLTPTLAGASSANGGTTVCISCHTSTPDGTYVMYTRDTGPNGRPRAIDARSVTSASAPAASDISPSALALFARSVQGAPVMTPTHYSASDAFAISVLYDPADIGSQNYELVWTDLHATSASGSGILARTGDPNTGVASPTWRRDGTAIAYVSSSSAGEAVVSNGPTMDVYTIPYNNHQGGAATALPGASDPNYHEFYPVYSPNDTLLAFNRTPNTCNYGTDPSQQCGSSYNQVAAELFVVAGNGGSALRLRANDPPTCTTLTSPGLTNAWPRWAPQSQASGSFNYYWIVFSSKRRPATGLNPQLYVAAIVTKVVNNVETLYADYPAVYVLAQDATQNNHTPAWDNFNVQGIPN
jgi:hypothetical protein